MHVYHAQSMNCLAFDLIKIAWSRFSRESG